MPLSREDQLTMEKSPYYLTSKKAPVRILNLNPKMKFIIMIRDPVKRAVSQFVHDFKRIIIKSFRSKKYKKVDRYFNELVLNKNGSIKNPPVHYLVTHGMYVVHYKYWLKYFPKEQFLIVNGENFIKNPYEEVKKAEKFLNLKPYIQKDHFIYDKNKGFFCMNKKQEKNKTECMGLDKGRKHPNISVSVLRKLNEFYKPYSKELFELIKRKPFWKI
jgi:hypothetical protein